MGGLGYRVLVTGVAGFLGSHLAERLIALGHEVIGLDNLSSGSLNNVSHLLGNPKFMFVNADVKRPEAYSDYLNNIDSIVHMAANPEVRASVELPRVSFDENVVATFRLLEVSRKFDVKTFVFASSSTVYGDAKTFPTPEDHPVDPISIYGASKAISELLLSTYVKLYGMRGISLRYANAVGPRLTHGVIWDFVQKLRRNPEELEILGDGSQRKSYIYVDDAIEATIIVAENFRGTYDAFNIGNIDWVTVREIAEIVARVMSLKPRLVFKPATSDGRGWPGDVKYMLLSIEKLRRLFGWRPRLTPRDAVELTARWLASRP